MNPHPPEIAKPLLTPRQRDLLRWGALGMTDKAIATELKLSVNTVKQGLARLRGKIGPFERHMLPGLALLFGLVSIADVCKPGLLLLQDLAPDNPESINTF